MVFLDAYSASKHEHSRYLWTDTIGLAEQRCQLGQPSLADAVCGGGVSRSVSPRRGAQGVGEFFQLTMAFARVGTDRMNFIECVGGTASLSTHAHIGKEHTQNE